MLAIPKFILKPGYRSQAEDTSPEVDAFQFWLLRQRSPQQRLAMGKALNRSARQFSINCFYKRFPNLSHQEFARKLALAWLQENCHPNYIPQGNKMTWVQDSIALAAQLHPIFESLDIPYYITGGVAAIAFGEPRTTQDLDIVISIELKDISLLAIELERIGFYVPGLEDVISGRMQTLQVTHIESIARADLMITGNDEFDRIKFERRQQYEIPEGTEVYLASPEDLILNKLRWGKRSKSEKQWRDVLGILKVQAVSLDFDYLNYWADYLGLSEDLTLAIQESGL
ncbi:hypothetical protein [Phormidium nigroviride]